MDFIEYGTYTKKIETHHLWIGLVGWSDLIEPQTWFDKKGKANGLMCLLR